MNSVAFVKKFFKVFFFRPHLLFETHESKALAMNFNLNVC